MKIEFADSFWESLETLNRQQTWWYRTWSVFRYGIPNFFKNVWYFRKDLYKFESWDYRFNLNLFERSLEATADYLENRGIEVSESRDKKVAQMRRVLELLKNNREDNFIYRAEDELGEMAHNEGTPDEEAHNVKVIKRAQELEKKEWKELWRIIKGTKYTTYDDYDGSDIRGWWD